jgi:hypothetical protein
LCFCYDETLFPLKSKGQKRLPSYGYRGLLQIINKLLGLFTSLRRALGMSTDKEKLNELVGKVEELAVTLGKVSEELRAVSTSLKSLATGQITQPPPAQTAQAPAAREAGLKQRSIDEIRMSFPEDLENRLGFEEKGDFIIIKPKQFLGSENFAKIASAVRGMGGEYISAGKDSHFRVPKKKA